MRKEKLTTAYLFRIFYLNSILVLFCLGCKEEKIEYLTYKDMFYPNQTLMYGPYFALEVENQGNVEKIILQNRHLMNRLTHTGGFDVEGYKDSVKYSIKKQLPLKINDALFTSFKMDNLFIKPDCYIDSLFETTPLKVILYDVISSPPPKNNKYWNYYLGLDKDLGEDFNYKYLIYKLFQNELYVTVDDESGYYFIMYDSKGLKELK